MIRSLTFDEYRRMVESFHGIAAPGVMIGGFMVDLAYRHLPREGLFNSICETPKCLPDAIQLLTPCSIGNQWLTIINTGRYALTFYDKATGEGIRIFIAREKLEPWAGIAGWFLRLGPKGDLEKLLAEIENAGTSLFGVMPIRVSPSFLAKKESGPVAFCPSCNEAYHARDGKLCPACRERILPYL